MKNENGYYLRLTTGSFIPDEVNVFEHQGIKLFSSLYTEQYRVTEIKTGYQLGAAAMVEQDAIDGAKKHIDSIGADKVKEAIKIAVAKTKEGFVYDSEKKEWISMYKEESIEDKK